jgi:hypothetical protein
MSTALFVQYLVIALAVISSTAYVVHRQWPRLWRRARIQCAVPLLREGRAGWMQRLGRAIAPVPRTAGAAGCGDCNHCGD